MKSGHFVLWDLNPVSINFPRIFIVRFIIYVPIKGIKLLGFKDRSELRFEDNIKHSQFIYPDELVSTDILGLLYPCRLDYSLSGILGQQTDI